MKTSQELHTQHRETSSEIEFLKKELAFLLKILRNCYSTNMNLEKTKQLDAYWKGFEFNITKLDTLYNNLHSGETEIAYLFQNELIGSDTTLMENPLIGAVKKANVEIQVLKESFYEFMHGCNACARKSI